MLLSTTRPEIANFLQHVLYNEITGIETAELYMEDDSPWIGSTIRDLSLIDALSALAWLASGRPKDLGFEYAPPLDYVIQPYEVLIVITPMQYFDEMRVQGRRAKRTSARRRFASTLIPQRPASGLAI